MQRLLQVLPVAGAMLVEHDEIERQSLGAQVLVRLEQIAEERQLGAVGESRQQHGSVAGDAVLPQFGLAAAVRQDGVAGAQPGIGVEQAAAEALEQDRVVDGEAEVPQLDLAVRAGERQRPGDGAPVVVLLHEAVGLFFGLGKAGDEGDAGRAAGRQPHELTQRDDRVEHRAGRVRQRVGGRQRDRIPERAAAPDEARAVGLELRRRADAPAAAEQVEEIGPGAARARPARADQRITLGQRRRLDEQVRERRVREVGLRRRQHDFRVAGEIEAARLAAVVGDRDPPQLDVVLGRDDDLGARLQASVDPAEHRPVEREGDFELVGVASDRLMGGRPDRTGLQIANEAEVAPFVGGDVLPPARHRQVLPAAVAAAGIGHHDASRSRSRAGAPRGLRVCGVT